jgi:hypothetical protein
MSNLSQFLPQILYKLMLFPESEYIAPIREEIDAVVEKYGWTKEALGKMYKLDSFMREVSRTKGFSARTLFSIIRFYSAYTDIKRHSCLK